MLKNQAIEWCWRRLKGFAGQKLRRAEARRNIEDAVMVLLSVARDHSSQEAERMLLWARSHGLVPPPGPRGPNTNKHRRRARRA